MTVFKSQFFSIITIVAVQINTACSKISDYTTVCSAIDPNLDDCVKNSANEILKHLGKGIPEYNIPNISPYVFPGYEVGGPVFTMYMSLSDIKLFGFDQLYITRGSADLSNYTLSFNSFLANQTILMKFEVKGKFMLFPVNGYGSSRVSMFDNDIALKMIGEPYIKNGTTYLKMKDFQMSIVPRHMTIHFDNFFDGNKILGELMQKVSNDNWKELYTYVKPWTEQIARDTVVMESEKILSKVPYGELFKDVQL